MFILYYFSPREQVGKQISFATHKCYCSLSCVPLVDMLFALRNISSFPLVSPN